jgi:N-acetylated-alpha-linked acidic dipeptidase
VTDPQKKVSVLERARAARILGRRSLDSPPEDRREARERADLRIAALGSGSDYTPFLQHLGISSLNVGFGGEGEGGSYHSIYDSIDHYTRFIDPTFEYGVALAQTAGRLTLRLANADVLPLDFTAFAETVSRYAKEVQKLADDLREETEEENRRVRDKTYELAADPKEAFVAPGARDPVPFVNFAPLQNAVARLQQSAGQYRKAATARAASATPLTPDAQKTLDGVLLGAERTLTRPEGLPGRPWFRHQVYAPGFYTGYGVKTLPGVREALELRKWDEAGAQAAIVARHLEAFAREIDRATALTKVE